MAQIVTNQAYVTFSYDGAEGSKTNESNIVTSTKKDKYDFSVEKTSTSECFRAGDNITFFVTIKNIGCRCLGKFYVYDNLGGEGYMSYVSGSARLMADESLIEITPTSTSPLEFYINHKLEKDQVMILQYTVEINENISNEVESITNEAKVNACPCTDCESNDERTNNSNCVEKTACYTITRCNYAEVLITKEITSDNICCDDEVDYIITLTNTGTVDATNVVVTDYLPSEFTLMDIHSENNGVVYKYDESEYDLSEANFLTLPNATGTVIYVPSVAPGVDNITRIRIHGHM